MSDLIERLRHPIYAEPTAGWALKNDVTRADMNEAANEIERLRALPVSPAPAGLRARVLGALNDFADTAPESDESWESWYAAAFDLVSTKISKIFDEVSPAPAGEWQTIESAPRGPYGAGPRILLWDTFSVFEGFWNGGSFCDTHCSARPHATHWRPLPSPPAIKSGETT